jgi:DNA-binding CsgD family transcriptional regulator
MPQQDSRTANSSFADWIESDGVAGDAVEIARMSALHARAAEEAGAAIARELNGPLTALLLYMGEIKQHSQRLPQGGASQDYLQMIVENALQQTERVCVLVKQIGGGDAASAVHGAREVQLGRLRRAEAAASPVVEGRKPLTRREREVLNLISQGYSNKEGAARMQISPRTFESHRAEAMRKLGARNTADLVRAALLHPTD